MRVINKKSSDSNDERCPVCCCLDTISFLFQSTCRHYSLSYNKTLVSEHPTSQEPHFIWSIEKARMRMKGLDCQSLKTVNAMANLQPLFWTLVHKPP